MTRARGYPGGVEQTATVITVTDRAAGKIRQLAAKEGRAEPVLRVRVVAGGCSGFSYELSFADAAEGDDHVIPAADGVRVLVDRRSAPIVEGFDPRVQRRAPRWRPQDAEPPRDARVRVRRLVLRLSSV